MSDLRAVSTVYQQTSVSSLLTRLWSKKFSATFNLLSSAVATPNELVTTFTSNPSKHPLLVSTEITDEGHTSSGRAFVLPFTFLNQVQRLAASNSRFSLVNESTSKVLHVRQGLTKNRVFFLFSKF